jgi:predicted ArsR family transcriptional regulator
MPALMSAARTRILHLLKRSDGLSAGELAKELGVTAVAVRKQLSALENESLVTTRTRPGVRGRPSTVYVVSEAGEAHFPQTYNRLVVDLLQDLSALDGDGQVNRLFHLRNERLAKTYGLRLAGLPFAEAVQELARARNDDGYMASVEERDGHLVLSEHNCPIYDVAQRFPQACQCEHELFEKVLQTTIKRELTLVEGGTACRYEFDSAASANSSSDSEADDIDR